ncbi:MAG TPA: anhydro-N-acetylmuramic acid kinase [Candidatus Binatus sp.]|jgi:anhydro-N-acetylmuramic acid kinase|nr:anhydro-N-acetylmuramic acid kinase [Candidatus Binatus sp.]
MSKRAQTMIVAGVMSGTSADGINVALVRVGEAQGLGERSGTASGSRGQECPRHIIKLLGHAEYSYPAKVRAAVLAAMNATRASVADLARLNFVLGELYADAVLATQRQFRVRADLVGCHGQTLYHQGEAQAFLGRKVAATWQTGESALIAARVGVPVVSDFRPADMAAGGKGAPLVPYLDSILFRDAKIGRIVQNVGGIANLTAIPAGADASDAFAFDTGPGNMVIDAVTDALFGRAFDRGGKIAASGKVLESVVEPMLRHRFFRAKSPKTAGREEFGREFVREFLRRCGRSRKQDVVATATALTARSIADAVRRFVISKSETAAENSFREMILSGGGARNTTLVAMLAKELAPLGVKLRFSDEFGLPSEAKEAVAFAVLAYETWNRRPSNLPSATGAKRGAVLGKISYA